jgi:hypothetical protein
VIAALPVQFDVQYPRLDGDDDLFKNCSQYSLSRSN